MTMSYDGALVMPSSYIVMETDEMTYINGGWSGSTFAANLKGAYQNYKQARNALLMGGLSLGTIAATAYKSAKAIYVCYGATISSTAYIIGGIVVGTIAAVGILAGIYYLGNHRVWY